MSKVLYTGSFDPITKGHMNIIEQANLLFDEIVIGVLVNSKKNNSLFTIDERVEIISEIYKDISNIKVVKSSKATVDLALLYGCKAIIRGLRGITDFDSEIQLAQINKQISGGMINTVCLFADVNFQYVSSSVVKEIYRLDKDVSYYVDPIVKEKMLLKRRIINERS